MFIKEIEENADVSIEVYYTENRGLAQSSGTVINVNENEIEVRLSKDLIFYPEYGFRKIF